MNTATVEELAYLLKQAKAKKLPQPIFFLGAGASKTGGVPLANEIVKDILERHKDNPRIKSLTDNSKTYPKLMACLTQFQRNELLNEYIDRAKINVTHLYLAQLLIEGYVDYVLTVNFDNLFLRALALFNYFPPTYDLSNLKDLTNASFKEKSVFYLHGHLHGLWLLNTEDEMAKVKEIIPPILNSIKNDRPFIFIGYSGEDPIFEHIINLGSFTNGLYWVTYYNENPSERVCNSLLEIPLKNSFLVTGYDTDSFMLQLNAVLELPEPLIITKPFTVLKTILKNIVDIDDKEHFIGVKERMNIIKNDVEKSIQQFEKGIFQTDASLSEDISINLLKRKIIEVIIKRDFNPEKIKIIETDKNMLNNTEINYLMSNLYANWANDFYSENIIGDSLYKIYFERYKKSIELNSNNDYAYHNWGNLIANYAKTKNDEKLYQNSFEKYQRASEINPDKESIFNNWGNAIAELAKLKREEQFYKASFEKYKTAIELNPNYSAAFSNWGIALYELAKLKNEEQLYQESFIKFQKAIELNPQKYSTFKNFANATFELAKIKNDTTLFNLSNDIQRKADEIK